MRYAISNAQYVFYPLLTSHSSILIEHIKVNGVELYDFFEYCYCCRLEKSQEVRKPEFAYTSSYLRVDYAGRSIRSQPSEHATFIKKVCRFIETLINHSPICQVCDINSLS